MGWPLLVEGCGACGGCVVGGPEGSCLPVSWLSFRFGEEVFGPTEADAACLGFGLLLLPVTPCHVEAGGLLMESAVGLGLEHQMEFEALAILDLLSALETALALVFLMSSS